MWPGDGGAIYVQPSASLEVKRCYFVENAGFGFEGGRGGAIHVNEEASAVIDSCTFERNFGYGAGVWSMWDVDVRHCTFYGNEGWSGSAFYSVYGTYSIEFSAFYDNETWGTEGGAIAAHGQGTIFNNTIAFNLGRNDFAEVDAPNAIITRNIISNNEGWAVSCPAVPANFACNDVWGNTLDGSPTNYHIGCDLTGTNSNISANPLFCAPEIRNLTLNVASPCAAPVPSRLAAESWPRMSQARHPVLDASEFSPIL
jgi:hypothetical protein